MCENMQPDAASKRDLYIFFRGAVTPSPSAFSGKKNIYIFQVWGLGPLSTDLFTAATLELLVLHPLSLMHTRARFPPAWRTIFGAAAAHNGKPSRRWARCLPNLPKCCTFIKHLQRRKETQSERRRRRLTAKDRR